MKDIKKYLKDLGIEFKTHTHPPVFTCEQADDHYKNIKGVHAKNLFIKNRKSTKFFMVIIPFERKLDMDQLGKFLGDRLKFGNEDNLKELLDLTPGSVSPFGLINDEEGIVKVVIDRKVWESDYVAFHPNINTETLELKGEDFQGYIKSLKNKLVILE